MCFLFVWYFSEDKITMRILKRIIYFIVISMIINIILFGLFTVKGYEYIYNFGVKLNTKIVDVSDDLYEEYDFFKKQLNKNMVFFIKDKPDSESKILFFIDYIKYLNNETGIKYILDGVDYAAGQLINIYLQTGDENILNEVFDTVDVFDIYTEYRRLYYKKLYEYNALLDDTNNIKLYGIDTEAGDKKHSLLYLDYLLKKTQDKSIPSKINNIINGIRTDTDVYFVIKTIILLLISEYIVNILSAKFKSSKTPKYFPRILRS